MLQRKQLSLKIKPYQKYRIIALGMDGLKYEWNIQTTPDKRAWKQVGEFIEVGTFLNDGKYKVISIEETFFDWELNKLLNEIKSYKSIENLSAETSKLCTTCFGKKEIDCRMCDGSGGNCKRCNGTGKIICITCRGESRRYV